MFLNQLIIDFAIFYLFNCVNDIFFSPKLSRILLLISVMPDLGGLTSACLIWIAKLLLRPFIAIIPYFYKTALFSNHF